jgi:PAS domain S-box-containing protein
MNLTTTEPQVLDYKLLLTSLPGLFLILSPDFNIMEASDAYLQATLTNREELIGRNVFEVFPESQETHIEQGAANLKRSLLHVRNVGNSHTMPIQRYDILKPKNLGGNFEERYWLPSNHPILDQAGELVYIVHQVIDVTMQQMAQHYIQTNRERIEILAQANTDVIWDVDLLSNHLWWSENLKEIFGYDMHELPLNENWAECVHPEDHARVVQGINSVIDRGGRLWTDSYRFRRKNGTYAYVIERGYILRDENGIAYRMVGSLFDITDQINQEHQQVEQQLNETESNFQRLLDTLPNLAWTSEPGAAPGSRITFLNKAWYDYTGLPKNLLGGGEKVIYPKDLPKVTKLWVQSQADHQGYEQEIRLKNLQSGAYRWFLVHAIPVCDKDGKITTWLGTCTDIDEQKKLQEKLEAKDRYWERILTETHLHFAVFKGPLHVCEFITPALKKLLGNPETEGKSLAQAWPEAAAQGLIHILDNVYKTGNPFYGYEAEIKTALQENEPAQKNRLTFNCQPLCTESGVVEGIVAIASEINSQKNTSATFPFRT